MTLKTRKSGGNLKTLKMNKKILAMLKKLLFLLIVYGCAAPPKAPPVDLKGIMEIKVLEPGDSAFNNMTAIFKVDGRNDSFYTYLNDQWNIPRGKITVKKGKVFKEGIVLEPFIKKALKYWPFIFGQGVRGQKKHKVGDVFIEYSNWVKISQGEFPSDVWVSAPEFSLRLKINYGDKGAGED